MKVGLLFEIVGGAPAPAGAPPDWDAEYEPESTIESLEAALHYHHLETVRIGGVPELSAAIANGTLDVDAVLNISESYGSRNREAHAPVLLELAGVPCLGSDALTLSMSLDKHITKVVAQHAGLRTPPWLIVRSLACLDSAALPAFPVFVKPRYEGTAKGIAPTSRCDDMEALRAEVARQLNVYRQDLIIEAFIEGAEFTAGVTGTGEGAQAGPALQRAIERTTGIGLHALERYEKEGEAFAYDTPAAITLELEEAVRASARIAHDALECRDFSRSDFRVDTGGNVWFLEINPLPTFAVDSTFAVEAELAGIPYVEYLAEILAPGLRRLGLARP